MSSFLPARPNIIVDSDVDSAIQVGTDILMQELLRIKSQTVRGAPLDRDELSRLKVYMELLTKAKTAQREAPSSNTQNNIMVSAEPVKTLLEKARATKPE